jgi:hypothetical protein
MPDASIDGIQFFNGATAGGAFRLSQRATASATEAIDGWEVEIAAGSMIVVSRGGGAKSYAEARTLALAAANKGLDFLCLRGQEPLAIRHAAGEHISWWMEGQESVVRVLSAPTVTFHVGRPTILGGIQVAPPPPAWQESARYFRLSQLAEDLFDSFRNLYLALESILDHIAPQRTTPYEREGVWFLRALGEAGKLIDLAAHAQPGSTDPVAALFDELYLSTRNLIFHAKSSRASLLPHSTADRNAVEETMRRAAHLYLSLANEVIHLRLPGSGIFAAFWRANIDAIASRLGMAVTNDASPFNAADTVINPAGGEVVELEVQRFPQHDQPFEHAFLGIVQGAKVASLGRVTRICSTVDDEPQTAGVPEGDFLIGDIDRFEALIILRARNADGPKRDFAS